MNNTEGPRVEASKAYGDKIKEIFNLPVDYQDERLTTVQAERMLVEQADVSRDKRKKLLINWLLNLFCKTTSIECFNKL